MSYADTLNGMCREPDEVKTVGQCDECGDDISEGDTYYDIEGTWYCEDCICQFRCEGGEE